MTSAIFAVQSFSTSPMLEDLCAASTLLARRGETGEILFWMLVFGGVIGVICGGAYAATYFANQWKYNSHASLFYGLCRVHGLERGDRSLLKQVVRHHGMDQPARIFTEPQWLEPAKLGKSFEAKAQQLLVLRKKLFAIKKEIAKK